jgi:hypothetical protein
MGFFSDYISKNANENTKKVVNIEWVLNKLDEIWTAFTRNKNGLVPAPGGSTSTKYLREDGAWVVLPVYTHPTGNNHIPSGGKYRTNIAME